MEKKKLFLVVKYVLTGLWWLALLLGAVLIISFISAHSRGEVPRIGKYAVMHIVSQSMEPSIEQGTYILVKQVPPEEIKKGDVICFYSNDPTIYGCPNTHRVVEEPYTEGGELYFITQGDKNLIPDKYPAQGDRLIGVWVANLSGVTAFLGFVTKHFMWIFASLLLLCVVAMLVVNTKKTNKKEDK